MMLVGQKSYSLVKFKRLDRAETKKLVHHPRHNFWRFTPIDELWLIEELLQNSLLIR